MLFTSEVDTVIIATVAYTFLHSDPTRTWSSHSTFCSSILISA